MKTMKKLASLLLALAMIFALAVTASAQTETASGGTASITIENAAKGETYTIYKVFNAMVSTAQSEGESVSIVYTGDIPTSLADCFEKDTNGFISLKDGVTETVTVDALKAWAETEDAKNNKIADAVSDGSVLTFANIPYGYYVITSTQGGGGAITVDSTKPDATVKDKNSTTPKELTKTADKENYNIGDTVTYTVKFKTANWNGTGENPEKITAYTIADSLPAGLTLQTVTKITIDAAEYKVNGEVPQFDENNQIMIPWVDDDDNFLYKNGAEVIVTYTAKLNENAVIDGAGNVNKVTLTWGNDSKLEATETVYTYAIALKKVDQSGNALEGAEFQLPFYVKSVNGTYVYAGTAAGTGLTNTVASPDDGVIVIKGVAPGTYSITETKAPNGYNKLTTAISVEAKQTGATTTSTTWYIDANGNKVEETTENATDVTLSIEEFAASAELVVNKAGTELPTTGGMGTTLFYTLGGILVVAAIVLLVTKKRMSAE